MGSVADKIAKKILTSAHSFMFVGLRGVGKTVLLNEVQVAEPENGRGFGNCRLKSLGFEAVRRAAMRSANTENSWIGHDEAEEQ